jgi:hypothetical protein
MHRDLCPSKRWRWERWGQQPCPPAGHLLGQDWLGMHRPPDILPIAPDGDGQTSRHGCGAWCAPLAQALLRQDSGGEADHEPALPPVARAACDPAPACAAQPAPAARRAEWAAGGLPGGLPSSPAAGGWVRLGALPGGHGRGARRRRRVGSREKWLYFSYTRAHRHACLTQHLWYKFCSVLTVSSQADYQL